MNKRREAYRIYVQAEAGMAHTRRLIEGVALHAHRHSPPWRIQWGWAFPEEAELQRTGFDGAIRFHYDPPLDSHGLPTVWVCSAMLASDGVQVIPDNHEIGRIAARHFLERLHRQFAFVGSRRQLFASERLEGFREGLGGAEVREHSLVTEPFLAPVVQRALVRFVRYLPRGTALFAANDQLALHAAVACQRAGVAVPEEVSILGVDDDVLLAHAAPVPISSINPGSFEVGTRAAMRLGQLLAGEAGPARIERVPPGGVVARASSDVLATDDVGVAEAARLMREEACRGLTVADLCRRLGMGRRTFEQRFSRVVGRTPEAEMRRLRVERAKRLLATTELPVAQVAEEAGFGDAFYFSAAFRKATGLSPREWRGEGAARRGA